MRRPAMNQRHSRRGNTLPMVAISGTLLISFAAVAIDLGYDYVDAKAAIRG